MSMPCPVCKVDVQRKLGVLAECWILMQLMHFWGDKLHSFSAFRVSNESCPCFPECKPCSKSPFLWIVCLPFPNGWFRSLGHCFTHIHQIHVYHQASPECQAAVVQATGLGPVSKHVPNMLASWHVSIQPSLRKKKTGKERVPCSPTHCQNNLVWFLLFWICVPWDSQDPSCYSNECQEMLWLWIKALVDWWANRVF